MVNKRKWLLILPAAMAAIVLAILFQRGASEAFACAMVMLVLLTPIAVAIAAIWLSVRLLRSENRRTRSIGVPVAALVAAGLAFAI